MARANVFWCLNSNSSNASFGFNVRDSSKGGRQFIFGIRRGSGYSPFHLRQMFVISSCGQGLVIRKPILKNENVLFICILKTAKHTS